MAKKLTGPVVVIAYATDRNVFTASSWDTIDLLGEWWQPYRSTIDYENGAPAIPRHEMRKLVEQWLAKGGVSIVWAGAHPTVKDARLAAFNKYHGL